MQIDKQVLSKRFNAASSTYDQVASAQRQAADFLVRQLRSVWPDFYPEHILELGSGSGYLTELLLAIFPNSRFTVNDLSAEMLALAEQRLSSMASIDFNCSDFDNTQFTQVDLSISNFALQWSADLENTLKINFLRSKRLAFCCLLDGTFAAWHGLFKTCNLPSPVRNYWSFTHFETVLSALDPKDYFFTTETLKLSFENAHSVMRYLQSLGASLGNHTYSVSQLRQVLKHQQGPIELTYQLFFAFLIRTN